MSHAKCSVSERATNSWFSHPTSDSGSTHPYHGNSNWLASNTIGQSSDANGQSSDANGPLLSKYKVSNQYQPVENRWLRVSHVLRAREKYSQSEQGMPRIMRWSQLLRQETIGPQVANHLTKASLRTQLQVQPPTTHPPSHYSTA